MTSPEFEDRRHALSQRRPVWVAHTIVEHFDEAAQRYPDRPLVITDDHTWTYRAMQDRTNRLARGLTELGVTKGDRVAVMLTSGPEFICAVLSVLRTGAIAVPLNYLYRASELDYALTHSGASVLIGSTGVKGVDHLASLDEIRPGWTGRSSELAVVQVAGDVPLRTGVLTLHDVETLGGKSHADLSAIGADPFDTAQILYTSGTTGNPKGVLLTHDSMLRTAYSAVYSRAFQDGRRILFSLPMYHVFGFNEGFIASTFVGGAVIPRASFDAADMLAAIDRHEANDILCVPTMAIAMLESPALSTTDASTLSAMYCAAAPAPLWLWDRMAKALDITEMVTGYGMTEVGGSLTLTHLGGPVEALVNTVGSVKTADAADLPGQTVVAEVRIADPETGAALPQGEAGEICWRGPVVTEGFWNSRADQNAAFRDGWLRTGDLGLLRPDGHLVLTGRSKDIYKSGGEVVIPTEVENFLTSLPGVSQAFVVGLPDERWGEIGCAFIVPTPGADITAEQIQTACRNGLARFKVPRKVHFVDSAALPKTSTGKIQKFRLTELLEQSDAASSTVGAR